MSIIDKFSDDDYKNIVVLLNSLDINASSLKKIHLLRRIYFRMESTKCNTFQEYYKYVLQNQTEEKELRLTFSINVTHFFRDISIFDYIKNTILPKLLKSLSDNESIKFWSAGCADGAEPYSVAILLHQLNIPPTKARIIATDYNSDLLLKAKNGRYPLDYLKETPPHIHQKYFSFLSNASIEIKPFLKEYVDFKTQNLISTHFISPETNIDVILCRNVLIYFTREQQLNIFNNFYKTLKISGYLIIGRTENIPLSIQTKFTLVDKMHTIAIRI